MNFACELMDLCRGTQEVEAVLSEETVRDPLSRLKMAMEYEEKKVCDVTAGCLVSLPSFRLSHVNVVSTSQRARDTIGPSAHCASLLAYVSCQDPAEADDSLKMRE